MNDVSLPILVASAVIDSINPCAFGVLIFLLAYLAKNFADKRKMIIHASIYIFAVFITYLVAGLLLLEVIQSLGSFSVWAYGIVGAIVILAGLLEIKDYFFYGKWISLSIAPDNAKRIKMYINKISGNYWTSFSLGVFVALVELPCTGAVYLAVLFLMQSSGVEMHHILFLVLYNIIFVAPLMVITWFVVKGMSTDKFEQWRQKHKKLMRMSTGLLLVGLGVWMLMYAFV